MLDKLAAAARAAYVRHEDWDGQDEGNREMWRKAVRAVLEALPEPEPALLPPFPVLNADAGPTGGLKPGDVVSVRGVIATLGTRGTQARVELADDDHQPVWLNLACLTFIERFGLAEPTWQPGDLAEDERGVRYCYNDDGDAQPWLTLASPPSTRRWFSRAAIPGPLHRLTVTRQDAP